MVNVVDVVYVKTQKNPVWFSPGEISFVTKNVGYLCCKFGAQLCELCHGYGTSKFRTLNVRLKCSIVHIIIM